jgi:ABC-type lipoprotein release transport system permease subunit
MMESLALGVLGALAGLGFGYIGMLFLGRIQISSGTPFSLGLQMDSRVHWEWPERQA